MRTVAVVLAAGGGSRFQGDTHKLLAPFRGRPVVRWAVDAALGSGLRHTWIITGAVRLDEVLPPEVQIFHNERWADGQAVSLAIAVDLAVAHGFDAMVVGLGDQPLIEAQSWATMAAATSPIAVCTYGGKRGNPVRLGAEVWPLLDRTGDEGARGLMRRRPDLVQEVACSGAAADVDTVEDLTIWS